MESAPQVSTKGMRWSQKLAEDAAKNMCYVKVGEKGGVLHLSGAPNRWMKPDYQDDIYLPDFRIAGNPQVVAQVLINNNIPQEQVQEAFSNAITYQNYNVSQKEGGMAEVYRDEVENYKKFKESQNDENTSADLTKQLDYYHANLSQAVIKGSKRLGGSSQTSKGSPKGPKVPLAQRLAALPANKVLDVSAMRPNGTNVITIDQPGRTSKKVGVPGLMIVSSNPNNYVTAVRMLGPQYENFIQQYYVASAAANQGSTPAPAPTKVAAATAPKPTVVTKPQTVAAPTKAAVKMPKLSNLLGSGITVGSPVN